MQKKIQSLCLGLLLVLSCNIQGMQKIETAVVELESKEATALVELTNPEPVKRPGTPQVTRKYAVAGSDRDFALLSLRAGTKNKTRDEQTVTLASVSKDTMEEKLTLQEAIVDPIIKARVKQNYSGNPQHIRNSTLELVERAACLAHLGELAKQTEKDF